MLLFIDYYKMHHLPNETVCHIFKFVKDRIPVSRTCKKWVILLDDMYKQKLLSDRNDPYYFKKYLDEVRLLNIKNNIADITNHNCLNYICDKMRGDDVMLYNYGSHLLIKNCQVNNVSRPKYIQWLYGKCSGFGLRNQEIINTCLKYKAYDILVIFSYMYSFPELFGRYYRRETNIDTVICDFEIIISKNILTINQIYREIFKSEILLKTQLLTYLKSKINPDVIKLLEI
jgi:hypothetical protein